MIAGSALTCPRCSRTLRPESWANAQQGSCFSCKTDFEFVAFPALQASATPATPQVAEVAADSVCYFHAENRAEAVCEGCGRLLCPVCAVPFGGQKLCPSCIAASRTSQSEVVTRDRILYDGIALSLALLPLLLWPFTLFSAPLALGVVIYGWNKPGSIVRGRSRVRFIVAALFALLQIAGWVAFLVFWMTSPARIRP